MDYTTSKMFVIGVGILVTIMLFSAFLLIISEVKKIYNYTENTDISIYSKYDNIYSQYAGSVMNTVDLLNTLRKYEEDSTVIIYSNAISKGKIEKLEGKKDNIDRIDEQIRKNKIGYETEYNVSVNEENNYINITFTIR